MRPRAGARARWGPWRVGVGLGVALLGVACASTPRGTTDPPPPSEDRTDDPEFVAAREAARPEFESQADVLAAGVYERFVHPDSVRQARPSRPARESIREAPRRNAEPGGDPSTEELLGTLAGEPWYDRAEPPRPAAEPPSGEPARAANPRSDAPGVDDISILDDASEGPWTLQLGAYTSETGALVRIRQLERAFPKASRWYEGEAGMWRVYLGRWPDRQRAERARAAVAARGYVDAWVTRAP